VAPASNVASIDTELDWTQLAAIPESYATAWVALNDNLGLERGQSLLVRGATSALGQAAVNIAKDLGARVIATARCEERAEVLRSLGAAEVVIDTGAIAGRLQELIGGGVDRALDLVGNSVLREGEAVAGVRVRGDRRGPPHDGVQPGNRQTRGGRPVGGVERPVGTGSVILRQKIPSERGLG
jgi:NADPH:quinone reductase-like Zn-dependent oxidoreductase